MNSDAQIRRLYDVVVVGAGPAGSIVALRQAADKRVLVVDRRRAPWRKPCDGILTPMSLRVLETVPQAQLVDLDSTEASVLRIFDYDNGRAEALPLENHRMVDREALDTALRNCLSSHPGVTLLDQTNVIEWAEGASDLQVSLRRQGRVHNIRTRVLVDASGAAALARERSGRPLPTALAVQLWYPPQGAPQRCEWIFDRTETPFYLWVIRKPTALVLGGVFPHQKARTARASIEKRLARRFAVEGEPWRVEGARMAMPTRREDAQLLVGPVLAVGEAAGLINVGTGEGISFALRSGFACGNAIALAQGDPLKAAVLYAEFALPLVDEVTIKAQHAYQLFGVEQRGQMSADDILVPVPHTPLQAAL